jgi:hypothetical protein
MTVIRLESHRGAAPGPWRGDELRELEAIFAAFRHQGDAVEFVVGATERGEPQFYVIAPEPDSDCVLCISRVGRHYLVEDGAGGLITRVSDLGQLADERPQIVRRHRTMVAKGIGAWLAVRASVEEKVEAMTGEPLELLTHVAPQLAALV